MKIVYNSPVVLTFALACTLVLAVNLATGNLLLPLFSVGPTMHWSNPLDYLRLFTYVLGHAGVQHLVGNMMMLLLLGPLLEEKYGAKLLLGMIAITAVVTGLLQVLLFDESLLGASGIVFMMIILASVTNAKRGTIPVTLLLVVVLYIGQEFYNAIGSDQISQFAHIIGGTCGAALGLARVGRATTRTAS